MWISVQPTFRAVILERARFSEFVSSVRGL